MSFAAQMNHALAHARASLVGTVTIAVSVVGPDFALAHARASVIVIAYTESTSDLQVRRAREQARGIERSEIQRIARVSKRVKIQSATSAASSFHNHFIK